MIQWDEKTQKRLFEMKDELVELLSSTSTVSDQNWLEEYNHWKEENPYEFIAYLQDGFKELPPKEILYFNETDPCCVLFFDTVSMSVFISKSIVKYTRETVAAVVSEIHPDKKTKIINDYFEFIEKSKRYDTAITLLYNASGESGVLQGEHPIDIVPTAYFLHETLEQYSIETIFLFFTYWRITSDDVYLKKMLEASTKYIREYFQDYGKDSDMHLDWHIEKEPIIHQLNILSHWIEVICFQTNNMLEEYKKRKWFISIDKLVDDLSFPPFISYFEMLKYKGLYQNSDNETVARKGTYFHRYGVWIKTVDIISILSQTASIIYNMPEEKSKAYGVTRKALLEVADNLKKLKEYFSGLLFTHKEFYDSMRQKYSFLVLETYEKNARIVNSSVDDLIHFTDGVLSNDIDVLMQSKQKFVSQIAGFLSDEQKLILDKYMTRVIDRVKEEIKKLDIYTVLYGTVTDDFKEYAQHLLMYPDIFCSLVSAEYLYSQYVKGKQAIDKFDYSCISILYYMALEDFANKLLYTGYATDILDANASAVYVNWRLYVSSQSKYLDAKNCNFNRHVYKFKKTSEIGNLGYLFRSLSQEPEYEKYLKGKYPKIDILKLNDFGQKLIDIAPRRNEAAHGGNLVSYSDVCIDKQKIYDFSTTNYRGLILELFGIIFPK